MIKAFALSIAAAGLCTVAPVAMAQAYDFSNFAANGQSFQGATLGLMTLSSENGTLIYTDNYGGGIFDGAGGASDITLTFSSAVSSVTVRAGDGAGDDDAFGLLVYEYGSNALLGSFYSPVFGGANEPEWYTLTVSGLGNIGRVVIDPCNSGVCPGTSGAFGGVAVTDINLVAASVPEPSTYMLMVAGLGIMGWVGRRRRTA